MKNFKLYIKTGTTQILLSQFNNWTLDDELPLSSVYDEKLTEAENDQYTLTFSAAAKLPLRQNKHNGSNFIENYFLKFLKIGQELRLEINNGEKIIDFVITKSNPSFGRETTIYNFEAQDIFSYRYAKMNSGYTYSSLDRTKKYEDVLVAKPIEKMVHEVFLDNNLTEWRIVSPKEDDPYLYGQKCIAEEVGTSTYNAIIEICNLFQAYLKVNFFRKEVSFYSKQDRKFSGYRYWPTVNIKSLTRDEDGAELASILRVSGGTDEYGAQIPLCPAVPDSLEEVLSAKEDEWTGDNFNFSKDFYWKNNLYSGNDLEKVKGHRIKTVTDKTVTIETTWDGGSSSYSYHTEKEESGIEADIWLIPVDEKIKGYVLGRQEWTDAPKILNWAQKHNSTTFTQLFIKDMESKVEQEDMNYVGNEIIPTLRQFLMIAHKMPHLDQFLIDWSYFKNKTSFMSASAYEELINFYNGKYAAANLKIKMLTSAYYTLQYEILSAETSLQVLAESYIANCKQVKPAKDGEDNDTDKKFEDIQETLAELMAKMQSELRAENYSYYKYLNYLYGKNNIKTYWREHFLEKRDNYKKLLEEAQEELNQNPEILAEDKEDYKNYVVIQREAKRANLNQKINLYKSLSIGWSEDNGDGFTADGLYDLLYNTIEEIYNESRVEKNWLIEDDSLEKQINEARSEINKDLINIYRKYGRYLLEATYENADETNSVSLFEQATAHFNNIKNPQVNFNISVINVHDLERISVPDLRVGNVIKVYTPNMQEAEDIIITNLNYNLRLPDSISITVEQFSKYKNYLYKMIQSVRR